MKWPFVSRDRLELLQHNFDEARTQYRVERGILEAEAGTWQQMYEAERARHDVTLERMHQLRVAGANAQPAGLPPVERPSKPADKAIEQVVSQRYGSNTLMGSLLRRELQKYVLAERQKPDADEERIADKVLHWTDPDADEDAA
jgi:hypothetical protein